MALGHWLKDYIGPKGSANSGGGGTALVVRLDHTEGEQGTASFNMVYDKTWREVRDALSNGMYVAVVDDRNGSSMQMQITVAQTDSGDGYTVISTNSDLLYACSEDGYLQTKSCGGIG